MSKKNNSLIGFVGLIIVIIFLTIYFSIQNNFIFESNRDDQRKKDINKIYFYLEQEYQKNKYYPEDINYQLLKKELPLVDPDGNPINTRNSDYIYETYNCQNNQCQNFVLTAKLNKEADYIKQN